MFFNSIEYFIFLPLVYLVFYFCGDRARWLVLLLSSVCFYAALKLPQLLLALCLVVLITYFAGIGIGKCATEEKKRAVFWAGTVGNLLVLVYLKYLPFLIQNLNDLSRGHAWEINLTEGRLFVTIGVSYYVFQAISYLIDCYLEIGKAEMHVGYLALYLSFFPKLLQGPIERAGDLLPQLRAKYEFDYDNMRSGLLLFAWGLFKKSAVADRLGPCINSVYGDVHAYGGPALLLATYLYAIQIYYDFSGYTDMARGAARLFNIRLTENFNSPYLATSVADFWRRWHISFSRWILDYIFKPLQMQFRNLKNLGTALALLATFLVSGIWHGASWCFVVWGMLHGLYLAASVFYRPYQKSIYKKCGLGNAWIRKIWQIFITFNLVCFAWIFFRAASIADALFIIRQMFTIAAGAKTFMFMQYKGDMISALVAMAVIISVYLTGKHTNIVKTFFTSPAWFRWIAYYTLIFAVIYLGKLFDVKEFIYFKF
jgi:D-alanyl-lipoteichoic acid acyltransferase DltB (MBOAT superfamily)